MFLIVKELNVVELIFVIYRIIWYFIYLVYNRYYFEVKYFFELYEIWFFYIFSVVEIDYYVWYLCSVVNYFNFRFFVFILECFVFIFDFFIYSMLKFWLDFVIIDIEWFGGILLMFFVLLGMKYLRKSLDLIEVVLI